MRTSYSALETFKSCPLKYKYQEIDKIRVPKGVEAIFGASIHSSLKYMFERAPLYPSLDQIIDFFRNVWDEKKETLTLSPDILNSYYQEGLKILERFYKTNQPWNFNVVDLESRFEVELGEHTLAGIIDRIDKNPEDETFEIIDYKTGKRLPGQDTADKDLQLSIYHLALTHRWPHLDPAKIKLSLYFLKHGEKISTARNQKQLENTKKTVLETIADIQKKIEKNSDFPPLPSGLCDYCGYRSICPMWRHLYDKKFAKIKGQEELDKIIKEYFELKAGSEKNSERMDELKVLIGRFMEEQKLERVFGDNGYFTKKISERFVYDMKKIKKILEDLGKWSEVATKKQFSTITASKKKIKEL